MSSPTRVPITPKDTEFKGLLAYLQSNFGVPRNAKSVSVYMDMDSPLEITCTFLPERFEARCDMAPHETAADVAPPPRLTAPKVVNMKPVEVSVVKGEIVKPTPGMELIPLTATGRPVRAKKDDFRPVVMEGQTDIEEAIADSPPWDVAG